MSGGQRTALGIGISLGVLALAALFALCFYIRRYRRKNAGAEAPAAVRPDGNTTLGGYYSPVPLPDNMSKGAITPLVPPREMEQPTDRFELPGTLT